MHSIDNQRISRNQLFHFIDRNKTILEIGPACGPSFRGALVSYFDVVQIDNCPEITYLSHTGDLSIIKDKKFDYCFSSHNFEHLFDIVLHLQNISQLMIRPGYYFLAIPDYRYCFDHFKSPTSIVDVMLAYQNKEGYTLKQHLERALMCHNDAGAHWRGDHGNVLNDDFKKRFFDLMESYNANPLNWIDNHKWYFCSENFRFVMTALRKLEVIDFDVKVVTQTAQDSLEFYAILGVA